MPLAEPIPVAVLSTNRPDRLVELLEALTRQQDATLRGRRVLLVQDGGRSRFGGAPVWSDAVALANLDHLRRIVPHAIPLPSLLHLGPALTRARAECLLFEDLGEPAAIAMHDGMLPGRHWLASMDRLVGFALADARIGDVAADGDPRASLAEQRANAGGLIPLRRPLGYGLTRQHWLRRNIYMAPYLDILRRADEAARDHAAIHALLQSWGVAASDTSADAAIAHACVLTGASRLNTMANHARSLTPPANRPGFGGVELFPDGPFPATPPGAAVLDSILAQAAADSFGGG